MNEAVEKRDGREGSKSGREHARCKHAIPELSPKTVQLNQLTLVTAEPSHHGTRLSKAERKQRPGGQPVENSRSDCVVIAYVKEFVECWGSIFCPGPIVLDQADLTLRAGSEIGY